MPSSNATLEEINAINYASTLFYQYGSFVLLCLGTIGHIFNIYVFTRPILHSNPCTRYFLAATISGTFVTCVNVPLRLLQFGFPAYNPFGYSTASCKILTYIVFSSRAYTPWCIVLASIDRFLCSSQSATMRRWSNLRVANRTILIVLIVIGLFYLYVPFQFENITGFGRCPSNQSTYPLFNGIWNFLVIDFGPSIAMFMFGSLTVRHVQQSIKRVTFRNIQVQTQLGRQKTTDRQLIQMMIVQCIYFILMATPISIWYVYTSISIYVVPDALEFAKMNLFGYVGGILSLTSACTSFYLFTLSSQLFRREIMQLFKRQQ